MGAIAQAYIHCFWGKPGQQFSLQVCMQKKVPEFPLTHDLRCISSSCCSIFEEISTKREQPLFMQKCLWTGIILQDKSAFWKHVFGNPSYSLYKSFFRFVSHWKTLIVGKTILPGCWNAPLSGVKKDLCSTDRKSEEKSEGGVKSLLINKTAVVTIHSFIICK